MKENSLWKMGKKKRLKTLMIESVVVFVVTVLSDDHQLDANVSVSSVMAAFATSLLLLLLLHATFVVVIDAIIDAVIVLITRRRNCTIVVL
jgi:hypothetical protein